MFGILPALYENQTLYSWCGLTHALSGSTCVQTTSTRLFGAPYAALSHDFPSRLMALDRSTGSALGCPREIALRNTLLGYYLSIASQSRAEQIIGMLRTGAIGHLKMLLGITASRVGGHHPLKGCERCFVEDEASTGWAYWHIEHQPPQSWSAPDTTLHFLWRGIRSHRSIGGTGCCRDTTGTMTGPRFQYQAMQP
jgi:hypothetical protein